MKRFGIYLAIVAASILVLILIAAFLLKEPTYQGKPIRYWMEKVDSTKLENNEGLHAIGIEAIDVV